MSQGIVFLFLSHLILPCKTPEGLTKRQGEKISSAPLEEEWAINQGQMVSKSNITCLYFLNFFAPKYYNEAPRYLLANMPQQNLKPSADLRMLRQGKTIPHCGTGFEKAS